MLPAMLGARTPAGAEVAGRTARPGVAIEQCQSARGGAVIFVEATPDTWRRGADPDRPPGEGHAGVGTHRAVVAPGPRRPLRPRPGLPPRHIHLHVQADSRPLDGAPSPSRFIISGSIVAARAVAFQRRTVSPRLTSVRIVIRSACAWPPRVSGRLPVCSSPVPQWSGGTVSVERHGCAARRCAAAVGVDHSSAGGSSGSLRWRLARNSIWQRVSSPRTTTTRSGPSGTRRRVTSAAHVSELRRRTHDGGRDRVTCVPAASHHRYVMTRPTAYWIFRTNWNVDFGGSGTRISEEVEPRFREVEHGFRKWNIDSGGSGTSDSWVVNARR